jgi:hypothetical protein
MRQEDESTTSYDRRSIPKHRVFMFLDARFCFSPYYPSFICFVCSPSVAVQPYEPTYHTSIPRMSNFSPSSDRGSLPNVWQCELTPFSRPESTQRPYRPSLRYVSLVALYRSNGYTYPPPKLKKPVSQNII